MKRRKQRDRMAHRRAQTKRLIAMVRQAMDDAADAFTDGLIGYVDAHKQFAHEVIDGIAKELCQTVARKAARLAVQQFGLADFGKWKGGVVA